MGQVETPEMRYSQRMSSSPKAFSVIIPVRNEALALKRTLEALAQQNVPCDSFEIIVADGGSSDGSQDVIRGFAQEMERRGLLVKLIDNPAKTAASGLNLAIEQSEGEIIVRVDGRTTVAPDYLDRVRLALKENGADCVGGLQVSQSQTLWGLAYAEATGHWAGHGGAHYRFQGKPGPVDTVYLGAWPRKTFTTYGLFDVNLERNQDDEHNMRIRSQGGRIYLDPTIRSTYRPRENPVALAHQYFSYGLWKPVSLLRTPGEIKLRHGALPVLVLGFLVLATMTFLAVPHSAQALAAYSLGYSTVIMLSAAVIATASQQPVLWPALVVNFVVMHISYGLGFLLGLPRALLRKYHEARTNPHVMRTPL